MIAAYPLQWPAGWPRTPSYQRKRGRFSTTRRSDFGRRAQDLTIFDSVERVLAELSRMNIARDDIVISTNVPTRLDGLPRSDARKPDDPGVAVYWQEKRGAGARRVIAIDHYSDVADNLAAIAATLDAMRSIERHGGARILERAFTGFTALPEPGSSSRLSWRDVFGLQGAPDPCPQSLIDEAYRKRAAKAHPDRGGSHEAMVTLNNARDIAYRESGIST